jgi:hypothetical protein
LPAHLRDRTSGADGCQALGCTAAASELVEVQLPAAWEVSERYTVLTVSAAACPEHAPELRRRTEALLVARADLRALLTVVDDALPAERKLRDRADAAEARLGLATDRAEYAEAALRLLEEELLPGELNHLVPAARHTTGADLTAFLERDLEDQLTLGVSGDHALQRVRRWAAETLGTRQGVGRSR